MRDEPDLDAAMYVAKEILGEEEPYTATIAIRNMARVLIQIAEATPEVDKVVAALGHLYAGVFYAVEMESMPIDQAVPYLEKQIELASERLGHDRCQEILNDHGMWTQKRESVDSFDVIIPASAIEQVGDHVCLQADEQGDWLGPSRCPACMRGRGDESE